MKWKTMIAALFLAACGLNASSVSLFPKARSPRSAGFSPERLRKIDALIEAHIAKGEIPGAVTFIARHGRIVHFEAFGHMDIERSRPMPKDAIFRVASMGKLVTSMAVMMLFEEGRFMLSDPVAEYIPEFEKMKVAVFDPTDHSIAATVPAQNPITIHDLLRHTSGSVYPGKYAGLDSLFESVDLDARGVASADFIRKLAALPLACEPGTQWEYGYSMDVLSYLVEVLTGERFSHFCRERIFKPLGLDKTDFFIAERNLDKLTTEYRYANGELKPTDSPENTGYRKIPEGNTGSGWLLSTASEYALLCQLLLNGGEVNGARLLGRKTVELMLADQVSVLPAEKRYKPYAGFGIGGAVLTDVGGSGGHGSAGMFYWAGARNTYFFIDPAEDLVGVMMMQVTPFRHLDLLEKFKSLCYQAIIGK